MCTQSRTVKVAMSLLINDFEGCCWMPHRIPVFLRHEPLCHNLCRANGHIMVCCLGRGSHHIFRQPGSPVTSALHQQPFSSILDSARTADCIVIHKLIGFSVDRKDFLLVITCVLTERCNCPDIPRDTSCRSIQHNRSHLLFFCRPSGKELPQYTRSPAL